MADFPKDISKILSKHPSTGETLELLDVNDVFDQQAFPASDVHLAIPLNRLISFLTMAHFSP